VKNRIYAAKELKQNLKHCKQLRKLYLQTDKLKKKMLQAINQIPLLIMIIALHFKII
jgi:hypothetical protein